MSYDFIARKNSGSGGLGSSGFSGYSGPAGSNGTLGISGFSGFSGSVGLTGISGFSGYSGPTGSTGTSGFSGFSGVAGSTGGTGTSGFSGYSGTNGLSGSGGASGFSGFSGSAGSSGFSGYSGRSGFSGYSGPAASSGFSGYSGTGGSTGSTGTSGFSGYSGLSGFLGLDPLNKRFAQVTANPHNTSRVAYGTTSVAPIGTPANQSDSSGTWHRLTTAATTDDYVIQVSGSEWRCNDGAEGVFVIRTGSNISSIRLFVGFSQTGSPVGASVPNETFALFRYDTSTDGTAFFRCISGSSDSTFTATTSTLAIATSTIYKLRIKLNGSTSIIFSYWDGSAWVTLATHTTNMPSATQSCAGGIALQALADAAKAIDWSRYTFISGI